MFMLAKDLNRWLVEPCVRNACVEPCRCGMVKDVGTDGQPMPLFTPGKSASTDTYDPLGLPALPSRCKQYRYYMNKGFKDEDEPAYPLRAYMDTHALAEHYNHPYWITYQEWCEDYGKKYQEKGKAKDTRVNRYREEQAYAYDFDRDVTYLSEIPIGDFIFTKTIPGRFGLEPPVSKKRLMDDPSDNLFIHNYYRYYFYPTEKTWPGALMVNPWHEAAVDHWIKTKFNNEPYVVFQWRHEFATPEQLPWCAQNLYNAAAVLPQVSNTTSRVALLIDMPPPGEGGHFWVDNIPDEQGVRTKVVQWFLDRKFWFYDADHPQIDSGILAIRDYLVGRKAALYVTCSGNNPNNVCHICFKPGSNYADKIVHARNQDGKKSTINWMDLPTDTAFRIP
jgi:hypothetical protein